MTNFPNGFDDDTTLPFINDNITQEGAVAVNALRDVAFAVEQTIGLGAPGSTPSIAARLGVSLNPDGTINPSAIASLGLVTLPITQDQIAVNAMIPESKLMLDHRTQDLFNYIRDLSKDVNLVDGWISISGIKLEPHLIGAIYRHVMNQIDVTDDLVNYPYMNNKFHVPRDNTQSYNLVNDINNEFLFHQWADGYIQGKVQDVVTNGGTFYPSNYAHYAGGIFINPSRFTTIPQTASDLQSFADYVDSATLLLLGSRVQNFYHNGISRNSRSSSLLLDGYGPPVIPVTPAIAYLKGLGNSSSPVDDINTGDDIIEFKPVNDSSNLFDEQWAQVRPGDIVRINYGTVEVQFIILEKKYIQTGNKKFLVRIAGKNLEYSPNASARIDRPLFNNNKWGALSTSASEGLAGGSGYPASLIVATPRGAQALGIGFSPDEFNETHYLIYLAIYPDGIPADGYTVLPAIDVTGNAGTTPGAYTLDSIVAATNAAFRAPGYNYRFVAFQYQGNFGIMLADSYNNVSFSVMSGVVDGNGIYNQAATNIAFPNNVVDLFPTTGMVGPDPLGFGPFAANIASPPYLGSYSSANQAIVPTQVFVPLRRNNYYVNGSELERMSIDVGQILDSFGDGYWFGIVESQPNFYPGIRVETTYTINQDLSASQLRPGKTLVVQSAGQGGSFVDFGRFIIKSVTFSCNPIVTTITVYDATHGQGFIPTSSDGYGTTFAIYFNSDSVAFDAETATDFFSVTPFKRHFEVFVDSDANTYTHERGRLYVPANPAQTSVAVNDSILYVSSQIAAFDLVDISPKLRGYQYGSVNKIAVYMQSYDAPSGVYDGYLAAYDGTSLTHLGPFTTGKRGETTRFYDESNIDYIDFNLNINSLLSSFTNKIADIQLFPTLLLDEEIMGLATCQLNDVTQTVDYFLDKRQFGNISEEELTTSALNYISLPTRLQHFNGVIRGFDITNITNEFITLKGGVALVNGNFQQINQQIITVPKVKEFYSGTYYPINFALCVNSSGELVLLPLTDYDAVLGTPNAPTRLVTLYNAVTTNTYSSDSDIFSYILNSRKDLTILYVISSTVTGTGSGATVNLLTPIPPRDVRRYANDTDASILPILTDGYNQGNFRNLSAALDWLKFNSNFQNTLQVKGIYSIGSDPGLNFPLYIEGASATAGLTFTANMTTSDVNFINVGVQFAASLTATDVTFSGCNVILNSASLTGVAFSDSTVTINAPITTSGVVVFTNCVLNIPIQQAFTITSGLGFVNCIFNYIFNANPGGSPVAGYVPTDLVNAGSGLMYANLTSTLDGFTVSGCTFIYSFIDHFPMISIQLGGTSPTFSYGAIAHNVNITGNKFILLEPIDDPRAVIAVTSTITTPNPSSTTYPPFPKLVNWNIVENICNFDQMILVSTVRTVGQPITGHMLACNNVKITDNICGVIAYMNAADFVANDFNSAAGNLGTIRDKTDQLIIQRNSCKLITNLDSTGQYITFRSTDAATVADWVKVGTGPCTISDNACNWILVGTAVWSNDSHYPAANADGINIISNKLSPGNTSILQLYKDTNYSNVSLPSIGILLRADTSIQADYLAHMSTVANNSMSKRVLLQTNGVYDAYGYAACLKIQASANVYGNVCDGVVSGGLLPIAYLDGNSSGGPVINFNNNTLIRNGLLVAAYVEAANNNAVNLVKITDNIFDSTTVDGISNTNVGLNIPPTWTFCHNKNQTFYIELPLLDYALVGSANGAAPPEGGGTSNLSGPITPFYGNFVGDSNNMVIGKGFGTPTSTIINGPTFVNGQYTVVQDFVGATTGETRGFSIDIPLDRLLPDNTRIINAKMGALMFGSGVSQLDYTAPIGTYNGVTLAIMTYNNIQTSNSSNGILDVKANYQVIPVFIFVLGYDASANGYFQSTYPIQNSTEENNLKSNTQYLVVDLSGQTIVTNQNYRISAEINFSYRKATVDSCEFVFSPIVLQCLYV